MADGMKTSQLYKTGNQINHGSYMANLLKIKIDE